MVGARSDLTRAFEAARLSAEDRRQAVQAFQAVIEPCLVKLRSLAEDIDQQLMVPRLDARDPDDYGKRQHRLDADAKALLVRLSQMPIDLSISIANVALTMRLCTDSVGVWMLEQQMQSAGDWFEAVSKALNARSGVATFDGAALEARMAAAIEAVAKTEHMVATVARNSSEFALHAVVVLALFRQTNLSVSAKERLAHLRRAFESALKGDVDDALIEDFQAELTEFLSEELSELLQINRIRRWIIKPAHAAMGHKAINRAPNDTDLILDLCDLLDTLEEQLRDVKMAADRCATEIKALNPNQPNHNP